MASVMSARMRSGIAQPTSWSSIPWPRFGLLRRSVSRKRTRLARQPPRVSLKKRTGARVGISSRYHQPTTARSAARMWCLLRSLSCKRLRLSRKSPRRRQSDWQALTKYQLPRYRIRLSNHQPWRLRRVSQSSLWNRSSPNRGRCLSSSHAHHHTPGPATAVPGWTDAAGVHRRPDLHGFSGC